MKDAINLSKMTEWLDDLSEDWVSQAPSSSPPSLSQSGNGQTSLRHSKLRRSILSERSGSRDNIRLPSIPEKKAGKSSRRGLARRSLSAESAQFGDSVVVHRQPDRKSVSVSPPKARKSQDTPEWKRRLLKGEMGYGEQKDLFSTRGIESLFAKPPPPRKESFREGSRGLSFLRSLESLPSSPPPWPSEPEASYASPTKSAKGTMQGLEAVHEEDEESLGHRGPSGSQAANIEAADQSRMRNQHVEARVAAGQSIPHNQLGGRQRTQSRSILSLRQISGQSEQTSDDFSPVFISKHNTADGRIDYAPLDLSRSELAKQLQQLRDSQQAQSRKVSAQSQRSLENDDPSLARLQSENLPEDLPAGTPEVASIGDFVNVRRGGLSPDGSFFRRPLSPSPLRNVSGSTAVSTTAAGTESAGSTAGVRAQETQRQSSLPEDTVVRHASGFSQAESESTSHKTQDTQETAIRVTGRKHTSITEVVQRYSLCNPSGSDHTPPVAVDTNVQFGQGHLDEYSFPEDLSSCSLKQDGSENSLASHSPPSSVFPPGSQQPVKFRVESPSADVFDTFRGKRKLSKTSAQSTLSVYKRSTQRGDRNFVQQKISPVGQSASMALNADGKRPPTSPFKDPTPKRRRTLVTSEMLENVVHEAETSVQEAHAKMQSAVGRKRKDARYDSRSNVADPDVLAQRHILRPRNPTPSQRRRQQIEAELMDAVEHFVSSSPRLEAIKEHLSVADASGETSETETARLVATEVAAFNEKVAHGMVDHGRKRSVTTQDFLDEATKIMNFIRNKGKPNSGLGSLVESEVETKAPAPAEEQEEEQFPAPTSPLSISRPPTREGLRTGWRTRERQLDARVISHLKKYQDVDDDGFMASSLRSSRFGAEVERVASTVNKIESDPPGIHILDQKPHHRKRRESDATNEGHPSHRTNGSDHPTTQSSHTTADSSLGKTTASRKSDNVATLAPDVVAHLIPQEIAGMTFDQEKGIWVKARSPRKETKSQQDVSNLSQSEEDPFNGIPDLTVDEMRESDDFKRRPLTPLPRHLSEVDIPEAQSDSDSSTAKPTQAADGLNGDSNAATRTGYSQLPSASSGPEHDAVKDRSEPKTSQTTKRQNSSPKHWTADDDEEAEHEYSILEGRSKPKHHRVSELKVSISSPFIQVRTAKSAKNNLGYNAESGVMHYHETHGDAKPYDRAVSVTVTGAVAAPPVQSRHAELAPASPGLHDMTFYMSELPEFTLNQIDEREIQDRLVVKKARNGLVQDIEDRFAWGNHLLAKVLQDVEPNTDWEDLRKVNLHGKNITSLHILDVVCERLEKLDISSNELCQLSGAPPMIRSLNAQQNLLTSLTSWCHLVNLQYLDVSNNNIDSLRGFSCLLHLRELKADNNQIVSLEGLQELDALLKLSLRGNKIRAIDLVGYEL